MKTVLITGCSSGIGEATALALSQSFFIFAGVRNEIDGKALAKKAQGNGRGENLLPVILDVTDQNSIAQAFKIIEKKLGDTGLFAVINNAGISKDGPIELLSKDNFRKQFDVNVLGILAVTQTALPSLRQFQKLNHHPKSLEPRIINIGSMAGKVAIPFIGAYSASKYALESMSDTFRRELAPQNIKVILVEPWVVRTPIWTKIEDTPSTNEIEIAQLYSYSLARSERVTQKILNWAVSVEFVANVIQIAVTDVNPKTRYYVGFRAQLFAFFSKVCSDKMLDFILSNLASAFAFRISISLC